jgi:hypothetical protein
MLGLCHSSHDLLGIFVNTKLHAKWIGAAIFFAAPIAHAVDLGPLTITGFAKQEFSRASNICNDCQVKPGEDRHRHWADDITPGKTFGTDDASGSLFQPYIATKEFNLGKGWRVKALYSQRWRDGKVDIPGVVYEKNATVLHEDYGMLQLGAFPARGWSVADYPYGTQIGVADAWGASGSGYGLLGNAIRYSLPVRDVADGDLYLETTVDRGDSPSKVYKPLFVELYAQYVKGPWVFDVVAQDAKNGAPSAWSHGPFRGITFDPSDDLKATDDNRQRILMAMARYQYDAKTVLFGGVRFNSWSGARGTCTGIVPGTTNDCFYTPFFNVEALDPASTAHSATSTDISLGATYRIDQKWSLSAGMVHLGKAKTSNETPRGQSNTMTMNTLGVGYDIKPGLNVYAFTGMVNYKHKGLAPLSMPGHAAFSGVDSRVSKTGNWGGVGLVYTW